MDKWISEVEKAKLDLNKINQQISQAKMQSTQDSPQQQALQEVEE